MEEDSKKNRRFKHAFRITLVTVCAALFAFITVLIVTYSERLERIFIDTSVQSLNRSLNIIADYANGNTENEYDTIRLTGKYIADELDSNGGDEDSATIVSMLDAFCDHMDYTHVGLAEVTNERAQATLEDGSEATVSEWLLRLEYANDNLSVDIGNPPFTHAGMASSDAVVFRYKFAAAERNFILICEVAVDQLVDVLNISDYGSLGVTLLARPNGALEYAGGTINDERPETNNFFMYLRNNTDASDELIATTEAAFAEYEGGNFSVGIGGAEYYFSYRSIDKTNWICVRGIPRNLLINESLVEINRLSMNVVMTVIILALATLGMGAILIMTIAREKSSEKIIQREKLFSEMSRYISSSYAILPLGENEPSFLSLNFNATMGVDNFSFDDENISNWFGEKNVQKAQKIVNQEAEKVEFTVERNDRHYSFGVYDIGLLNGKRYVALVASDITESERIRELLIDNIKKANAANRTKTNFLSKMSHEIRTPLNAIIGFTQLGLNGEMHSAEQLKKYMEKIDESGKYLISLVSDILDINRIEEGKEKITPEVCDLRQVTDEVYIAFSGMAEQRGIRLVKSVNFDSLPCKADVVHLKQILNNLISNAIKFTESGGEVLLDIRANADNGAIAPVTFTVKDTGIGMSAEFMERMFAPFSQEKRGKQSGKMAGSGLGLAICKNLVEMQNGTIDVKSEVGVGTTITINLSFEEVLEKDTEAEEQETYDTSLLRGKKVLVVEDVDFNREIIVELLRGYGLEFDEATNGAEGVDKFAASKEGEYFAILMDIQMPIMNGYQATRAIRALKRKDAKEVRIMAMTADSFEDDVNRAMMSGMNKHFSKPINAKLIVEYLSLCAAGGGENGPDQN